MSGSEPIRGHHVINNAINKLFHNIIEKFINERQGLFNNKNYQTLLVDGVISRGSLLEQAYEGLLEKPIHDEIEKMVAFTPTGESHTDTNDAEFGKALEELVRTAITFFEFLFDEFKEGKSNEAIKSTPQFSSRLAVFTSAVVRITQGIEDGNPGRIPDDPLKYGMFVDRQALQWWLDVEKNQSKKAEKKKSFQKCRLVVKALLYRLTTRECQYPPEILKGLNPLAIRRGNNLPSATIFCGLACDLYEVHRRASPVVR